MNSPDYRDLYAVGQLSAKRLVKVLGEQVSLDMCWAKGMVGVLPLFNNEKDAKAYAGDILEVTQFTVVGTV
jgi:hypothetical protein